MVNLLALVFTVVLSLAHYYGESIQLYKRKEKLISIGAGVLLAYTILDLFPRVFAGITILHNALFFFILLGFSLHHIIEKYIYQHAAKNKRLKELKEVHSIAFFLYYIIIGIMIKEVTSEQNLQGWLLFFPLLFHTTLGTFSLRDIHKSIKEKKYIVLLLSSSPVIGFLIASIWSISPGIEYSVLGFISGVFLYIITREVIPKENKGDPIDFFFGIALYTLIIVITWII